MKKTILALFVASVLLLSAAAVFAAGNGWSGYNYNARVFVGTGEQYCMQKYDGNSAGQDSCKNYLKGYLNDKITMKWNEAWDTCNDVGDCTGAWTDNEWNGKFPGGSGEVWHYKIQWVDYSCGADGTQLPDGGYCIWGNYEVLMSHGTVGGEHIWEANGHAIPTGYGN